MTSSYARRVLFSDDGTISDLTIPLNDYRTDGIALSVVGAEDYLYIGQELPFNSLHIRMSSVADASASIDTIQYWNGSDWETAVDILDYTKDSGDTLKVNGYYNWKPDRDEASWAREDESQDIAALASGPLIYDLYWMRIKWNADFNVTLDFVGHKFCNDDELFSAYPDMNNQTLMDQWEQGAASGTKTDWDEQALMASEAILDDLKAGNIILSEAQILDAERFKRMGVHKTAETIYRGLGSPFKDDREVAKNSYKEARNLKNFSVDLNASGDLEDQEKTQKTSYLGR